MNLRHFENTARQSFWVVHIEAWRQSGLDRTNYCRQHGLWKCTFDRWLKYLAGKEAARKHVEYQAELRRVKRREAEEKRQKRRARLRFSVSTDERNRALQAFWAMHVEAMNWSGMGMREYAAALNLSPTSLRKWRDRLDEGEVEIDWRAHLHPSARPVVGTSASKKPADGLLTAPSKGEPEAPRQPIRRVFSDEEKRAIALESDQAGVSVSSVARKHGIVTGLLFRWRVQFGVAQKKRAKLAPVALDEGTPAARVLQDLMQRPDGMIAVELADGRRVFAPVGSGPDAVRAPVERGEIAP
ncbi:IS66 family insertion sequence element accessory protein TnpA [Xanthobacter versatilis]|uniref:IS66 family insertion sequence element accessory protein TnpA n=1 Tax=Xanthobacter autotrophicus (strain ATCC BAA-1158 / Py2) TaxID=78245 RepID=UPI0037281079